MNRATGHTIALILTIMATPLLRAEPLSNVTFAAFDVETTGFSPCNDRVLEIAVVKFRNGKILESASWMVNPGIPIPESATMINGISNSMVANCRKFQDIFPEFTNLVENSILLAHNSPFDTNFLKAEAKRHKLEFPDNSILDTLKLSRAWFTDARAHDLNSLQHHLALPHEESHRALGDSLTLMKVFMKGINKMPPDATLETLVKMAEIRKSGARKEPPTDTDKRRQEP